MAKPAEPTFETALKELDAIIARLENPETPLETVVATYTEGQKLLKVCQKRLEAAELSLEKALDEGKTESA
jgi:exodeoxyribonuclease VII small subunit